MMFGLLKRMWSDFQNMMWFKYTFCEDETCNNDEIIRLRAALTLSGIPAQAKGDPETTPPLRISVTRAKEIMEDVQKCL